MTDFAYSCANGRPKNSDNFLYGDVNGDLLISVYDDFAEKKDTPALSVKVNFDMILKRAIDYFRSRNVCKVECDERSNFCTCLVHKNNVTVEWQGENRAYLIRNGRLYQITFDKSSNLEGKEYLFDVEDGAIAKHKITFATHAGDMIFLCTDGAYGNLPNASIAEIWRRNPCMEEFCMSLVETSKRAGSMDNQTIVAFGI